MSARLDSQRLNAIFGTRPDILQGIQQAADSPARIALFNNIAVHVSEQLQGNGEPAHKKRKVEAASNGVDSSVPSGIDPAEEQVLLEVKEISVSVPQRKKFELCFTAEHLYARAPGTTVPAPNIVYAWRDIEYAFYLPVPEKAQVQHNYILFPRNSCFPSKPDQPTPEPLVFTIPATAPKAGTIGGSEASKAAAVSDTYHTLFHWIIGSRLKAVGNPVKIVSADPNKFRSMIRQAHRPNERAVHIGGYRGSKDGFLFFLETGILWGFKKPLIFIPLNRIQSTSYTNILQVTFNIVVEVMLDGDATEEFEFSMIDQQDYGGIDAYIKENRLQDRSMAEQRKGKLQLAENRAKKGAEEATDAAEGQAGDGMTELERAQQEVEQELQDDEDEDEEDYDPGSEGDSEGSGSSSDEDDDDDDDDEDDDAEGDEQDGEEGYDEEDAGEEEEEEVATEEPKVKVEPKVKPEAPATRKAPAVPVRQGWATISKPQPQQANGMDLDEKFDVVG